MGKESGRNKINRPEILAPAGSRDSFLAGLAAGADAVYCGLKQFSARMEAKNFDLEELATLTHLAHDKDSKVYLTLNSLLKPGDLDSNGRILERLNRWVKPDGLIIQDLSLIQLARQTGFSGEIHLSTLTNLSHSQALSLVKEKLNIQRIVVPRELNIDEIKALASACPPDLGLEVFIHGALCYGVSGRCYWSSYLGGKSGLRGRCVQPCRRLYSQKDQTRRFFSCQDLSLDVLVKVLLSIPQVRAWKIEGRKKGPHYVYYTVKAYQILRDLEDDPENKTIAKKTALGLLAQALGRTGTHYNFLPQRPQNPIQSKGQTASGLFVGHVQGAKQKPYMTPRKPLLPGDVLRVGYEDEAGHGIQRIAKSIPQKGRFYLKLSSNKPPAKGAPVFLIDRREKSLAEMLARLEEKAAKLRVSKVGSSNFKARLPARSAKKSASYELYVARTLNTGKRMGLTGLWISPENHSGLPKALYAKIWWWLPPVVWPQDEAALKAVVDKVCKNGGKNFVLNSPWQTAFFDSPKHLNLWAGPFCNLANSLAIKTMSLLTFSGAIISPEMSRKDILHLPAYSPLPLGILISGNWPLCISRSLDEDLKENVPFTSPKGEQAWVKKYGSNFWVYPNWKLDLTSKKNEFKKAGYQVLVHMIEPLPAGVKLKKRPGLWNWDLGLK
jgi:putative protease